MHLFAQTADNTLKVTGAEKLAFLAVLALLLAAAFIVWTVYLAVAKGTAGIMPEGFVGVMQRNGNWSRRLIDKRYWHIGKLQLPIPGRFFIRFPILTRVVRVDVRKRVTDTPEQQTIISEASVSFDLSISWKVLDPHAMLSVYEDYTVYVPAQLRKAALAAISAGGLEPFLSRNAEYAEWLTKAVNLAVANDVPGITIVSVNFEDVKIDEHLAAARAAALIGAGLARGNAAHIGSLLSGTLPSTIEALKKLGCNDDEARRLAVLLVASVNGTAVVPGGGAASSGGWPPPSTASAS